MRAVYPVLRTGLSSVGLTAPGASDSLVNLISMTGLFGYSLLLDLKSGVGLFESGQGGLLDATRQ
jgi:hypothetical protein